MRRLLRALGIGAAAVALGVAAYRAGRGAPRPGGGVLIDEATGRRFEVEGRSGPGLPELPVIAASGDLTTRRRRAYDVLLGTAATALLSVLYVRRRFYG